MSCCDAADLDAVEIAGTFFAGMLAVKPWHRKVKTLRTIGDRRRSALLSVILVRV